MALNAEMKVAGIEDLAAKIDTQRSQLDSTLSSMLAAVQRADEFQGNAAVKYDEWIAKWRAAQHDLLEAMNGASGLLKRYASSLSDLEDQVSQGFNV